LYKSKRKASKTGEIKMITQTVNRSTFINSFYKANRQDNFSYEGLSALYDYFDEMPETWELDPIAVCCDFAEYDLNDLRREYPDYKNASDEEILSYLKGNTMVMDLGTGSYIILAF
jgi:hypothetical protein